MNNDNFKIHVDHMLRKSFFTSVQCIENIMLKSNVEYIKVIHEVIMSVYMMNTTSVAIL